MRLGASSTITSLPNLVPLGISIRGMAATPNPPPATLSKSQPAEPEELVTDGRCFGSGDFDERIVAHSRFVVNMAVVVLPLRALVTRRRGFLSLR